MIKFDNYYDPISTVLRPLIFNDDHISDIIGCTFLLERRWGGRRFCASYGSFWAKKFFAVASLSPVRNTKVLIAAIKVHKNVSSFWYSFWFIVTKMFPRFFFIVILSQIYYFGDIVVFGPNKLTYLENRLEPSYCVSCLGHFSAKYRRKFWDWLPFPPWWTLSWRIKPVI